MPANQPVSLPQFNKPEQTRLTKIERDTYSDRPYCFSKDVTEQQYETHLDSITKEMLCLEELKIKPQRINPFDMVTIGTPKQSLKKLLLIDLDETLIHSYRQTTSFATPLLINHQGANYIYWISMRPFAKEFLQALKEHWIIYIFTASAEDYAKKIVKMLDPDGQCVTGVLSRNHCFSEKGIIIKDLRIIRNIPLKDIAILDNSVRSFLF
jgi:CTD small phosphatase-like protein 2